MNKNTDPFDSKPEFPGSGKVGPLYKRKKKHLYGVMREQVSWRLKKEVWECGCEKQLEGYHFFVFFVWGDLLLEHLRSLALLLVMNSEVSLLVNSDSTDRSFLLFLLCCSNVFLVSTPFRARQRERRMWSLQFLS